MGRITVAAACVAQGLDEVVRLGALCCGDHVCLAGVGPAIGDVVGDRAVHQGRVLRDHTDLGAQRILRDLCNVLAVDQNAAPLQVVKTQQQVHQRRFARAGAAHQADLFAGAHCEVQPVDHTATALGRAAAIGETGLFEAHLTTRHAECRCVRHVQHGARARQRFHAVLHRADVLEQAGHLPHDPVRHALQAQRHGGGCGHRANTNRPLRPQPQRHTRHTRCESHAQRVVDDLERTHQPHLGVARGHEVLHRGARKTGLAVVV